MIASNNSTTGDWYTINLDNTSTALNNTLGSVNLTTTAVPYITLRVTEPDIIVVADDDDEDDTTIVAEVPKNIEQMDIDEILHRAEQLKAQSVPISKELRLLKSTLMKRVDAKYTDDAQLNLFEDLGGLAIVDPDDVNAVLITSPKANIQFRVKKNLSRKWNEAFGYIVGEFEDIDGQILGLESIDQAHRTEDQQTEIEYLRVRLEALAFCIEKAETSVGSTMSGRFVVPKNK
jgi:hypothetical protein